MATELPVELSMERVPDFNCTACLPASGDPSTVVLAFARRSEYIDSDTSAVNECAAIVPASLQTTAMLGNTIGLRQQPPSRACAFDIFLWVPTHPRDGHHVTNHSQRSSAMLAALGAKAAGDEAAWCGGDVGVLPGSTASDLGRCLHT